VSAFPEHGARVLPALVAQLEAEPESRVEAHLVRNLGFYVREAVPAGDRRPYVERLQNLVESHDSEVVRFAAAVTLVSVTGDDATPAAIAVIEEAVTRPAVHRPAYRPGVAGDAYLESLVVGDACAALSHLSPARRWPIVSRILGRVGEPSAAHQVAILLLDSVLLGAGREVSYSGTPEASEDEVFYAVVHPRAADGVEERVYPRAESEVDITGLSSAQRQALQVVLDSPSVWGIRSNLLEVYGLPASPAALREKLGFSATRPTRQEP
jgi:hypothetical protein